MTSSQTVSDVTMTDEPVRYDAVLSPLYAVTNTFLGSVLQPHILPELKGVDLSDPGALVGSLGDQWQVWARYLVGYIVLISLGAVFVIVMPITGLFVCGCRCCCGRCGGKDLPSEPRNGKCKRLSCCLVLLVLVTVCLIGVICGTLANIALWEQTKTTGALQSVQKQFTSIDGYVQNTVTELDTAIKGSYSEAKTEMFQTLDDVGPYTRDVIGDLTQAAPLLNTLQTFTNNLIYLQQVLMYSDNSSQMLTSQGNALTSQLTSLRDSINADASLCTSTVQECTNVIGMLPDVTMAADYNDLGDLSVAMLAIDYVIHDDIVTQVSQGYAEFENIADSINSTWSSQVNDAKSQANNIEQEIDSLTTEVGSQIKELNLTSFSSDLDGFKETLQTYGDYRFYASIGLTVITGIIVVLVYLGLACGSCCKRPSYYKNITCSTRCGASSLLAAVGFIFVFAWIQMLVTMVLFLGGGVVYTELCRHLEDFSDDPVVGVVDNMMMTSLNLSLSIQNVTRECEKNASVYNALQLERFGFNLSQILNIESYGMNNVVGQFKTIPVDIGKVTIFSQATNETLQVLDLGMNTVNFTRFYPILAQNVTKTDFKVVADEMDAAAAHISTGPLSDRLTAHASTLRTLADGTVSFLRDLSANLTTSLEEIEDIMARTPIADLITDLTQSQDNLNSNGTKLIKGIINDTADDILNIMTSLMTSLDNDIRNDVGRCKPLHGAVTGIISVGCEDVLNPLNGFWCAHGWCLILFVPILIMALKLAGYYRVCLSFSSVGGGGEGERNMMPYEAYNNAAHDNNSPSSSSGKNSTTVTMNDYKKVGTLERESKA